MAPLTRVTDYYRHIDFSASEVHRSHPSIWTENCQNEARNERDCRRLEAIDVHRMHRRGTWSPASRSTQGPLSWQRTRSWIDSLTDSELRHGMAATTRCSRDLSDTWFSNIRGMQLHVSGVGLSFVPCEEHLSRRLRPNATVFTAQQNNAKAVTQTASCVTRGQAVN